MDVTEYTLPDTIHPQSFQAKLWRLVNNPAYTSICWDSNGEGILIDQQLFERQILSPCSLFPNKADTFKTDKFTSFIRQLHMYGFKKKKPLDEDNQLFPTDSVEMQHFFNPNFKKSHPELIEGLRRLARKKAERFPLFSFPHQESAHPSYPIKAQPWTVNFGTPVPPQYLIRGHGEALSPGVFNIFNQQYAGVASSSNAMNVQPGLRAPVGMVQYQQDNLSPGYRCFQEQQAVQLPLSGLQPGLYGYYQASPTFTMLCAEDQNQELLKKEHQEMKKHSNNLDTVFKIADEVMPPPSPACVVKETTPDPPHPQLQHNERTPFLSDLS